MMDVMRRIGSQSRSIIMERLDNSGDLQWVMIVDSPDPETTDTQRVYGGDVYTGGYPFGYKDMVQGSFRCSQTPIEDLVSSVRLKYGFHIPTRAWSNEKYVTPDATNFTVDGSTYSAAMEITRRDYNVLREITIEAPDIWDPAVAETLCKWYADHLSRRYITVEFETFINAVGLQPGHVLKFDQDIHDRVWLPGGLGGNWSFDQFNVVQTSLRQDVGQLARIYVKAVQNYRTATA